MADRVRRVNYAYVKVPNRPGQGARITDQLRQAGVNLLAYTAFPTRAGRAQVDLIAEDLGAIRRMARRNGWRLSDAKKGFLVQGEDKVGAVHRHLKKLAGIAGRATHSGPASWKHCLPAPESATIESATMDRGEMPGATAPGISFSARPPLRGELR
jgi:hypothetical protein